MDKYYYNLIIEMYYYIAS